ncbi:uncharacterized protein DUF4395 [Tamaricihabitans halophyticus]|uniref:Uncharacterized protein DUF4395 n=1 Tax=Tamaricihabitans halophyticus TaxID=1262583 RepID=A0A4R2QW72_9PSEU|nr:DUF4395 domain-containing protein [Tamaricihabitans halophyticus]TCP54360.1 uncharacterized protein DUF4395 [Tamaricihabitans halophyticus]
MTTGEPANASASHSIDPRGPRFAAWLTTVVLGVVLVTEWWPVLLAQTAVFAIGAFAGPGFAPYGVLYRRLVAPRLRPTSEWEEVAPVRFAQLVGFVFAAVGTVGFATGVVALGAVATAAALLAAFLNAAFGLCLGCEAYLLVRRLGQFGGRTAH